MLCVHESGVCCALMPAYIHGCVCMHEAAAPRHGVSVLNCIIVSPCQGSPDAKAAPLCPIPDSDGEDLAAIALVCAIMSYVSLRQQAWATTDIAMSRPIKASDGRAYIQRAR